jgi:hypothetical protein
LILMRSGFAPRVEESPDAVNNPQLPLLEPVRVVASQRDYAAVLAPVQLEQPRRQRARKPWNVCERRGAAAPAHGLAERRRQARGQAGVQRGGEKNIQRLTASWDGVSGRLSRADSAGAGIMQSG